MNAIDKESIAILRGQGHTYGSIAARLGLTESAIKAHCRRGGIVPQKSEGKPTTCLRCGGILKQQPKKKTRKFCSSACRVTWWNSHLRLVNRKAYYDIPCAHCGTFFQSYGNRGRKFCGHPCYVAHRWGKERGHDERAV